MSILQIVIQAPDATQKAKFEEEIISPRATHANKLAAMEVKMQVPYRGLSAH